eukprot:3675247-Prymnesium_polylepis.2
MALKLLVPISDGRRFDRISLRFQCIRTEGCTLLCIPRRETATPLLVSLLTPSLLSIGNFYLVCESVSVFGLSLPSRARVGAAREQQEHADRVLGVHAARGRAPSVEVAQVHLGRSTGNRVDTRPRNGPALGLHLVKVLRVRGRPARSQAGVVVQLTRFARHGIVARPLSVGAYAGALLRGKCLATGSPEQTRYAHDRSPLEVCVLVHGLHRARFSQNLRLEKREPAHHLGSLLCGFERCIAAFARAQDAAHTHLGHPSRKLGHGVPLPDLLCQSAQRRDHARVFKVKSQRP